MKWNFLRRTQATGRLFVFFAGWSMEEEGMNFLCSWTADDILLLYDYRGSETELCEAERHFDADFARIQNEYKLVNLAAWSFGVWFATRWLKRRNGRAGLQRTLAINGTFLPIDDAHGIGVRAFDLTLRSWKGDASYERFCARMGSEADFARRVSRRTSDELLQELEDIASAVKRQALSEVKSDMATGKFFDFAVVGGEDRIFPPAAQIRCFRELAPETQVIEKLGIGHDFRKAGAALFSDWEQNFLRVEQDV